MVLKETTLLGIMIVFSGFIHSVFTAQNVCKTYGSGIFETFNNTAFHLKSTCPVTLTRFTHAGVDCHIIIQRAPNGLMDRVEIIVNKVITFIHNNTLTVEGNRISLPYDHTYQHVFHYGIYTKLRSKLLPLSVTWYSVSDGVSLLRVQLDQDLVEGMSGLCGHQNSSETMQQLIFDNVPADGHCLTQDSVEDSNKICSNVMSHAKECLGSKHTKYKKLCYKNMHGIRHQEANCSFFKELSMRCGSSSPLWTVWRSTSSCSEPKCPGDLQYTELGHAFPPTCTNPQPIPEITSTCLPAQGKVLNDHIDGYRSIHVEDCPCVHARITYLPGQERRTKCQTCTCIRGKWSCSANTCPPKCIIEGQFITTFDGKQYSLPERCTYVASRGLSWTLNIQFSRQAVAIEKAYLNINQERYTFSANSVQLNNIDISDLSQTESTTVFWQSSMFIQVQTSFGLKMQVQVSPEIQIYLTLPPDQTTKGLCGTFNNDTSDDFTTFSGIVESSVQLFAQSWSMDSCSTTPTCISTDNEIFAEDNCDKLRDQNGVFAVCHDFVPVSPFVEACVQRTCRCSTALNECLCISFGNYAKACLAQGITVDDWRRTTNCLPSCQGNLQFGYTNLACNHTCRSVSGPDPTCEVVDDPVEGCSCISGTYLNNQDICSPHALCSCHHPGGVVPPGPVVIGRRQCMCENGQLRCVDVCDCPVGKICMDCSQIPVHTAYRTCDSLTKPLREDNNCISGCYCPEGLFEDHNGGCVTHDNCTCQFSGTVYLTGQSVETNCQICTCRGGEWSCIDEACSGACEVFGNGQYRTFDSKWYRFDGHCQYTLVKDAASGGHGQFAIKTESVPCCDETLTCSRAISVELLGEVILILSDMKVSERPLAGITKVLQAEPLYFINTVGLYIIISVPGLGFTVIWDKHTRVTIQLESQWRGRVLGLCGNFDGKVTNDLLTSSSSEVFSVRDFGNSWKTAAPPCSDVTEEIFPCERHSYCAAWAQRRCMILRSDTFQDCHLKVDPEPYYQACVLESCSCEFEGKFLGFCTAVAAYAEACNAKDTCINWRTPDLCPVYCDYYNEKGQCSWHYDPCGQVKTCGTNNLFTAKLEGCYPRCPAEVPYYDENTAKCSTLDNCTCHFMNRILTPLDEFCTPHRCCKCLKGNIVCISSTTTTSTSTFTTITEPTNTTQPTTMKPTTTTQTTTSGSTTKTTSMEPTTPTPPTTLKPTTTTEPPTSQSTTQSDTATTKRTTTTKTTTMEPKSTTQITTLEPTTSTEPPTSPSTTQSDASTMESTITTQSPTSGSTTHTDTTTTKSTTTTHLPTSESTTHTDTTTAEPTTKTTAVEPTTTTQLTTLEPTTTTEPPTSSSTTQSDASTMESTTTTQSPTSGSTRQSYTTTKEPSTTTQSSTSGSTTHTDTTTTKSTGTTHLPTSESTTQTDTTTAEPTTTTEPPTSQSTTQSYTTITERTTTTKTTSLKPTTTTQPTTLEPTSTPQSPTSQSTTQSYTTTAEPTTTTKTTTMEPTTKTQSTTLEPTGTTEPPTSQSTTQSYTTITERTTKTTSLKPTTTTQPTTLEPTSTPQSPTSQSTTQSYTSTSEPTITTKTTTMEPTTTTQPTTLEPTTTIEPPTSQSTTQSDTTTTELTTTTKTTTTEPTTTTQPTTMEPTTTTEPPTSQSTTQSNTTTMEHTTTTQSPTSGSTTQSDTTTMERTTTILPTTKIPTTTVSTTGFTIITGPTISSATTGPQIVNTTTVNHTTMSPSVTSVVSSTNSEHTTPVCECRDVMRNKSWPCGATWTEDCADKACRAGVIEVKSFTCPELKDRTDCPGNKKSLVKNETTCCKSWQCDCQCQLYGDPHYISFQGVAFDFLDNCTYTLVEERVLIHHFSITVDNYYCEPDFDASCTKGITLQYSNDTVTLMTVVEEDTEESMVESTLNQEIIKPPYDDQVFRFENNGGKVDVYIKPIRSYVSLTPFNTLVVNLAREHFLNNTQGQCGVCGGQSCIRKNGVVEKDNCCDKTAYGWVVDDPLKPYCKSPPKEVSCVNPPPPTRRPCYAPICDLLQHEVFAECGKMINLASVENNCRFDQCLTNSSCSSLEYAASECKRIGICVHWRPFTNGLCEVKCPKGMIYDECRQTPNDVCQGGMRVPAKPVDDLRSGCFCPDGQALAEEHKQICLPECPFCKGPLGEPMLVGSVWESNCHTCTCDNQTKTEVCTPKPPNPTPVCSPYSLLMSDCCNSQVCVMKTCEYNGTTYKVGDRWTDPSRPCESFSCTETGTELERRICPLQTCAEDSRVWDKNHCCYTCNVACTTRMTRMNVTVENCTQEVELPICEGQCETQHRLVQFHGTLQLEQDYKSCKERSYEMREITLTCRKNNPTHFKYRHITGCELKT